MLYNINSVLVVCVYYKYAYIGGAYWNVFFFFTEKMVYDQKRFGDCLSLHVIVFKS